MVPKKAHLARRRPPLSNNQNYPVNENNNKNTTQSRMNAMATGPSRHTLSVQDFAQVAPCPAQLEVQSTFDHSSGIEGMIRRLEQIQIQQEQDRVERNARFPALRQRREPQVAASSPSMTRIVMHSTSPMHFAPPTGVIHNTTHSNPGWMSDRFTNSLQGLAVPSMVPSRFTGPQGRQMSYKPYNNINSFSQSTTTNNSFRTEIQYHTASHTPGGPETPPAAYTHGQQIPDGSQHGTFYNSLNRSSSGFFDKSRHVGNDIQPYPQLSSIRGQQDLEGSQQGMDYDPLNRLNFRFIDNGRNVGNTIQRFPPVSNSCNQYSLVSSHHGTSSYTSCNCPSSGFLDNGRNVGNDIQRVQPVVAPFLNPRANTFQPGTSITQQGQPTESRAFQPSRMLQYIRGHAIPQESRIATGTNYRGDIYSKDFLAQVEGLPFSENCALWVINLSSGDYAAVFDLIHEGAVWALDIKTPKNGHSTFAFTLVFTRPEAARAFYNRANYGNVLSLGGNVLRVLPDRAGVRRRFTCETRVLIIDGPSNLVNWRYLQGQFDEACFYNVDRYCFTQSPDPNLTRMEVRFARVVGQAQTCKQKLDRNPAHSGILFTAYGPDPCGQ